LTAQFHVALVVSSVYVFAQCFAVPGTLTLSLLCGALFGFYKGLAMVMGKSSKLPQEIIQAIQGKRPFS
jgi:hypothetical protein